MILSKKEAPWTHVFDNQNSQKDHDLFKLHLRFAPDKFTHLVQGKLMDLLREALIEEIIPVFKYIDLISLQDSLTVQQSRLGQIKNPSEKQQAETNLKKDLRYQILPYTIYLYDKPELNDFPKIANLCFAIEKLLNEHKLDPGEQARLCQGDIALPPLKHVTCRQGWLKKERLNQIEYVPAFDALAARSKKECERSVHFSRLKRILNDSLLTKIKNRLFSKESQKEQSKEEVKSESSSDKKHR